MLLIKQGEPVAVLNPVEAAVAEHPQAKLKGSVEVYGDIVSPVFSEDDWESLDQCRVYRYPFNE